MVLPSLPPPPNNPNNAIAWSRPPASAANVNHLQHQQHQLHFPPPPPSSFRSNFDWSEPFAPVVPPPNNSHRLPQPPPRIEDPLPSSSAVPPMHTRLPPTQHRSHLHPSLPNLLPATSGNPFIHQQQLRSNPGPIPPFNNISHSRLPHAPTELTATPLNQASEVLAVGDTSQIGLSFASSHEAYANNGDFWHTVIDTNKQHQAAVAAAALVAAKQNTLPAVSNVPSVVPSVPASLFNSHPPPLPVTAPARPPVLPALPSSPPKNATATAASPTAVAPARPPASASRSRPVTNTAPGSKQVLSCDLCGRVFGQRGSLGRHKKAVHMGMRPFPCETCGFCFQQRYDLRKHILSVHQHERPFACEEKGCKAAFSRRAKLRKHVTTVHLKQRDFVCEICNSAFGEKSNKTKHIRAVHLQERKYACTMCHAAFKERGHRTKHMLTQHNVQAGSGASASNRNSVQQRAAESRALLAQQQQQQTQPQAPQQLVNILPQPQDGSR